MEFHRRSIFSLVFLAALTFLPSFVTAATFTRPLVVGSSGADVSALQRLLKDQGYFNYPSITQYFGPATAAALAKFQAAHGLEAFGGVGPRTRALLNGTPSGSVLAASTQLQNAGTTGAFVRQMTQGSTGTDVLALQQFLANKGFLSATPTGFFGSLTAQAVAAFQQSSGLEAVGSVGPKTLSLINLALTSTAINGGASTNAPAQNNEATSHAGTSAFITNFIPQAGGGAANSGKTSSGGSSSHNDSSGNVYGTNSAFASLFAAGSLSVPTTDAPATASQVSVTNPVTITIPGRTATISSHSAAAPHSKIATAARSTSHFSSRSTSILHRSPCLPQ
jgi:peptidoglycan hydrolase-like protein with peptidoglycan-binding domain